MDYQELYEKKLANAQNNLKKGFASKAAQKRCLEMVNSAYECLRNVVMYDILAVKCDKGFSPYTELVDQPAEQVKLTELYYLLPNYPYQLRRKHLNQLKDMYPVEAEQLEELAILRLQVKDYYNDKKPVQYIL